MHPYGRPDRDQGVVAYETGDDFIRLLFVDGSVYLYNAQQPGAKHVDEMKELAERGEGLTTYVNRFVRKAYAARER
jgi:hypothetical protein